MADARGQILLLSEYTDIFVVALLNIKAHSTQGILLLGLHKYSQTARIHTLNWGFLKKITTFSVQMTGRMENDRI